MKSKDNAPDNRFSCVAIFSSRIGLENSEEQKLVIQSYAKSMNLKIETYIDSSKYDSLNVSEIAEKFKKVRQSLVLTWRLDCLPSTIHSLDDIFEILAALGERKKSFLSIRDGIDTDTVAADFSICMHRAWREFKINRKAVNGRASLIKAKSRQHPTGRKKVRDDSVIFKLRSEGFTIREIAEKIGLSTTAVQRSLKTFKETPENINWLPTLG